MPVHDRRYRGYSGARRESRLRFLILSRHALRTVFATRFATLLFGLTCLIPLGYALFVYTVHNADLLLALGEKAPSADLIGPAFFYVFLTTQTSLGFLLVAFVAPTLIAPDLAHNSLALILSRPFSRVEYVLGKVVVLAGLLSVVTWVPGLLLVLLQASLAGTAWLSANANLAWALFAGSWIWIFVVVSLALALAALLRWRPLATGALFAVFLLGKAFGEAVANIAETRWGRIVSLKDVEATLWVDLFGLRGTAFSNFLPSDPLPVAACWLATVLAVTGAFALLHHRVRPLEISS
jgi:ABC-type transport system involved in multi-copper enzyme maturation permease subunit